MSQGNIGLSMSRRLVRAIMSGTNYESWSREDLIARLNALDKAKQTASASRSPSPNPIKSYPTRKIALKFCYSGWEYNGLAFQNGYTPLPTVEGALFNAMAYTRLVNGDKGPEGCGWEKCGRTDRGVSAAGQVISLNIRSALAGPDSTSPAESSSEEDDHTLTANFDALDVDSPLSGFPDLSTTPKPKKQRTKRTRELAYVSILNRVLPPTIRVIAWSPVSPNFSARFNCRHRHYKYFFSSNLPTTSSSLDINAMQDAASRLVGEHDFRNMCKIDPAKQITNFSRRILRAEISSVQGRTDEWVLDLVGTAFLYHQVRHIMAVLFMVGMGAEKPDIVDHLLRTTGENPVERKPEYQMADALPLVLWDCAYDDSDVSWRTTNAESDESDEDVAGSGTGPHLYEQVHNIHERSVIHAILDQHFKQAINALHSPPTMGSDDPLRIPLGGGTYKRMNKYVPLLKRKRQDKYEVINERWRTGKGAKKALEKAKEVNLEGDE